MNNINLWIKFVRGYLGYIQSCYVYKQDPKLYDSQFTIISYDELTSYLRRKSEQMNGRKLVVEFISDLDTNVMSNV